MNLPADPTAGRSNSVLLEFHLGPYINGSVAGFLTKEAARFDEAGDYPEVVPAA
jgi:hypothetical protein